MALSITIPVKLDILQESIKGLQSILKNLQPNTANFKAIEKIINSMTQQAQKLQGQLSVPFTNEAQFKSSNKTIEQLEESAARVAAVMSELQFSDLKLNPEQMNSFNQLNTQIVELQTNYQNFINEVKNSLLENTGNKSLIDNILGTKVATADFTQIKAAVDKHVADLEQAAEKERQAYEKMRNNADLAQRANLLTSSGEGGGINRNTVGNDIFKKFALYARSALLRIFSYA